MDDQVLIIIAAIVTIIIGLVGGSLLSKFKSFLGNLKELIEALEALITNGATEDEIQIAIKELKETTEDGLGLMAAIINVFKR